MYFISQTPVVFYFQRKKIAFTHILPKGYCAKTNVNLLPRYHFACRILRPLYCHLVYSSLMACPFNDGYRFQLLDICLSFTRTARRWGLNHSLLPSLINWRLSVSGDMKKSFPVLRIWLLICTLKYSFVDNLSIRKLNIS